MADKESEHIQDTPGRSESRMGDGDREGVEMRVLTEETGEELELA